jgi:hypothetical protein
MKRAQSWRIDRLVGRESPDKPHIKIAQLNLELISRLRKLHNAIGQLANTAPHHLSHPEVVRTLEQQLLHVMIRCLAEGAEVKATAGIQRRE